MDVNNIQQDIIDEYEMTVPDASSYKDIHLGMKDSIPIVDQKRIDIFLRQYDKGFDKKRRDFYNER